jgi:RHS repeat-associated protein
VGYHVAAGSTSKEARYLYGADGLRVKKWVRKGSLEESTVYIDHLFEHHRSPSIPATGSLPGGENDTLHVMDDKSRVALTRIGSAHRDDAGPAVTYHLGDHLGSSAVTASEDGAWTNREEFFAWGETSFGAFIRKRFRFAGKERCEESGLTYFGARFYAVSMSRWISPDPIAADMDRGLYSFARDNPVRFIDVNGLQAGEKERTENDQSRAAVAAFESVESQIERHQMSLEANGIGMYQGSDYKPTEKQKKDDEAKAAKVNITITETHCIGLLKDAVETYRDSLLQPWGPLNKRAADAGDRGTVLLKEFRSQAGATTMYIAAPGDKELAAAKKSRLGPTHAHRVKGTQSKEKIDVRLPLDQFISQKDAIAKMSDIPFAIGITVDDWGYHTFVFAYGNVYEVHYDEGPQSPRVFEKSSLEAFMTKWGSVVIAVPPGPWNFGAKPAEQPQPKRGR